MANNNAGQIVVGLDIPKSVSQINADIKKLEKQLAQVKATGALDTSATVKQINAQIAKLQAQLKAINIKANVDAKNVQKTGEQIGNNIAQGVNKGVDKATKQLNKIQHLRDTGKFTSQISDVTADYDRLSVVTDELKADFKTLNDLGKTLSTSADADELRQSYEQFNTILQKVKNSISIMDNEGLMYADQKKIDSLAESVLKFRDNNTKMSKDLRSKFTSLYNSLINGAKLTDKQVDELAASFTNLKLRVREAGQLGQSFGDKMKNAFKKFSEWGFATGIITSITSKFREAITELKEIDTLLTEISKANDKLSTSQLAEIRDNSFDIASRYGKKASNYLSGVQEASRAGYKNAEAIAELSTAIQGAGDVTEDVANSYVIATDKAYKLGGNIEKLTEIFDGTNKITNLNAVNMTELAEAMTIVGSTAASFGIDVNETTAAIATMSATTQQSGSEVARAFRAILLNIRQVSDEEEGIDAEGLTKYEKACNALGVSLKETRNGVLQTRDAMDVLKELSVEYNKLEENDLRRTELLNSVGGKLRATQLDALLRQWDTYETMLQQYADGTGSMAREAEKTSKSLEGSLNRLSNTWTDTVENVLSSDLLKGIVELFNTLLGGINKLTDALGGLGTIGLGVGLFKGIKNVGEGKMYPFIVLNSQQ